MAVNKLDVIQMDKLYIGLNEVKSKVRLYHSAL